MESSIPNPEQSTRQRLRIVVQGIVQGVGFRPFVYGLAVRQELTGFVLNNSMGVVIEVEGKLQALEAFQHALYEEKPPLAQIVSLTVESIPLRHETTFLIAHSESASERQALITPDTAPCDDCLRELFDPTDRRYRYPFINCTNCGPRFTIIQDVPYDRDKTTMRVFTLCPACAQEFVDPLNRRFHAQPNACPVCGPQVYLLRKDKEGSLYDTKSDDPITQAAQDLTKGMIVAVKGLGGYHLACNALDAETVRLLRQRKRRVAKPFALMVPDIETIRQLCHISSAEAALLQGRQRPIMLLQRLNTCSVAPDVTPESEILRIMLPYTPLHHLLLRAFAEICQPGVPAVLVMTSANVSGEPISYKDADTKGGLYALADSMLLHNREIYMRCDDSAMRVSDTGEQFIRRSRGYTPEPITLPFELPTPLLACGGYFKNTICLAKGEQAFISHHIGDLENVQTLRSFREGIEHFQRLFGITPQAVAYDLHPEYLATKYALDTAMLPKIGIQHHHAHIASVMVEHRLTEPVIGIAADGAGYGTDGAVWGCEILVADLLQFERYAHLAYIPLPEGELAVYHPWSIAAVYLAHTYGDASLELDLPFVRQMDQRTRHLLSQVTAKNRNYLQTSSLARLFDAVAALVGIHSDGTYEDLTAIELETQARRWTDPVTSYPFVVQQGKPALLDVIPLIAALVNDRAQGLPTEYIAKRFHLSVAHMLADVCSEVRKQTKLNKVALSGEVFQNQLLLKQLIGLLEEMAFEVYVNQLVPPSDGGLSLGQIGIAAGQLRNLARIR